jgi:hypothetical protein
MRKDDHPDRGQLIDFAEDETAADVRARIEAHLTGCRICKAYVESLKSTFAALETDIVPEPPETFFTYLAGRARQRSGSARRRLLSVFAPGLAAATLVVVLMWWLTESPGYPVDSVDIIMADMTTGEIMEAVFVGPGVEGLFLDGSEDELNQIETYIIENENIHDLLNGLDEAEKERFMDYLEGSMTEGDGTSGLMRGFNRKEC